MKFQKIYLLCTISHAASGRCTPPKLGKKMMKEKDTGYRKLKIQHMEGSKVIPRVMMKGDPTFAPSIEGD